MTPTDTHEVEPKLVGYATEFLRGYSETIGRYYGGTRILLFSRGNIVWKYFPLWGRDLGRYLSFAALFTPYDFYLFFLDEQDCLLKVWREASEADGFDRDWTFNAPADKRICDAKRFLDIDETLLVPIAPSGLDCVNIPGTNFMASSIETIKRDAYAHGVQFGNQAGAAAELVLPQLLAADERQRALDSMQQRYEGLEHSDISAQARGQEFEKLWRDVLEFYGWRPKKIRIPGEENDFTAIYQSLHVLGEVRWFSGPMTGGKMREFLGKLDPRPQTVGLFISHSGLDAGAWGVVRRAVNSKTVVVFSRDEIDSVLLRRVDPGEVFEDRLREAYDYIFEQGHDR